MFDCDDICLCLDRERLECLGRILGNVIFDEELDDDDFKKAIELNNLVYEHLEEI